MGTWELVSLVIPVPLLLIPTEVSKVLAKGLLKKMLPLPRLKSHPLLKLLQLLMDFLFSDMVFPLFTTTPPSNGLDIRSPDSKELPGVPVERSADAEPGYYGYPYGYYGYPYYGYRTGN